MQAVARLLNDLVSEGVIAGYALFGAVAQMRYTEAVATLDADVLIALPDEEGLDILGPLYAACRRRGFHPEGEAVRVGDWPVQFMPVFSPLAREALERAEEADIEGARVRVVSAPHLAALALSVGRAKDFARILALRESGAASDGEIAGIADRHGLREAWDRFRERFDAST